MAGVKRTALALLAVVALAGPMLTACASPKQAGERKARERADDIADQLERDLGRGVRNVGGDARNVAGAEVVGREDVVLLDASGQVNSDDPAVIDVRITGHVPPYDSGGIGGDSWPETTVHRCYTFVLRNYDAVREAGAACDDEEAGSDEEEPSQPSSPLPTSPPTIALGEAEVAVLRDVLTRFDYAPDVTDALGSALPPEVSLNVDAANGTIGAGIRAPAPTRDCLLGRRLPDGQVEVWIPPEILVEPGEASCDGLTAVAGGAQTSPH